MPRHGRSHTAYLFITLGLIIAGHALTSGCTAPWTSDSGSSMSYLNPWSDGDEKEEEPSHDWDKPRTVGDLTVPGGMNNAKIKGVTLVTGLHGTGSDPPPSAARDLLLNEMRILQVDQPQQWLASPHTALVMLEAVIPPGAREGDTIDVTVFAPPETDTTSLENGYSPSTRLTEMAFLGGRARKGNDIAMASGPIVLDSVIEGNNSKANMRRGRILGGAVMMEERPLGLGLIEGEVSIAASAAIGAAINGRFHMYREGTKQGVATPMTDKFITLDVHPRYKESISRYMRVIRFIPLSRSTEFRRRYIAECEAELLVESTAQAGALKLEAIGKEAVPSLMKGLNSENELVRFCSAESLAYMNDSACIEPLTEAARTNNGFRFRALQALGSFDDLDVIDSLEGLLHEESAEARYGAFDQLKKRSNQLPSIAGELLDNHVHLHHVRSASSPMVHFRLQDRPEIVVFGTEVRLNGDVAFVGQNGLTIRSSGHRKVKVTRFQADGGELEKECSSDLKEIIKALTEVECGYGEIVRNVFALRNEGYLTARVEVNAMPRPDRSYVRSEELIAKESDEQENFTDNFSQSSETAKTEESSEVTTYADGDDTLIPTFD
ncbi:flagellar basal body P-ring protein [Bremerella volcania]|uniref:Flagellar basal body P-ring protein n=2 Tax=Bremerella volcania TaxID=2527984 RepID=A0A518C7X1_9BACT|nr:flagellar basal body P-ring protein [Bremerella volcania]